MSRMYLVILSVSAWLLPRRDDEGVARSYIEEEQRRQETGWPQRMERYIRDTTLDPVSDTRRYDRL